MKKIIWVFVVPSVVVAFGAYLAYIFNKESAELRYSLSEKIPSKFLAASPAETVQLIKIRNNGNIAANNVKIKIDGVVLENDVLKNSIDDTFTEYNSNGYFESTYKFLPPSGEISYALKTSGNGIAKTNIKITHDKGVAMEALETNRSFFLENAGLLISSSVILIYLILLLRYLRSSSIENSISRGKFQNYVEYLHKTRPFYFPQEKWIASRRSYIEKDFKDTYVFEKKNIEEFETYKILNKDKPNYVSDDEWDLLTGVAQKKFTENVIYKIRSSYSGLKIGEFISANKPKNLSSDRWREIVKVASEYFVFVGISELKYFDSKEQLIEELKKGAPNIVDTDFAVRYEKILKRRYYLVLFDEMVKSSNPLEYLSRADLSYISSAEKTTVCAIGYTMCLCRTFDSKWSSAEAYLKTKNMFMEELQNDVSKKIEVNHVNQYEKILNDKYSLLIFKEMILEDNPLEYLSRADLSNLSGSEKNSLHDIGYKFCLYRMIDSTLRSPADFFNKPRPEWIKEIDYANLERIVHSSILLNEELEKQKALTSQIESEAISFGELKQKVLKQLKIIDDALTNPESLSKIEEYDNPFSAGNFKNLRNLVAKASLPV